MLRPPWPPRLRLASLGQFRLESGAVIEDAVVGYRTLGSLNAAGSNAVLVAPWYQGTSGQLARQVGPGKLVDTSRYFVVLADAFGNGVASSPSSSHAQPGARFPSFSIGDIVESHHQLLRREFGITRLHAVVGISMGGMQAFQWVMTRPDFIERAVAIVGSPQSQPDDRVRLNELIATVRRPATGRVAGALRQLKPRTAWNEFWLHPEDYVRQAEAIAELDLLRPFGGSFGRAAAGVRIPVLVVTTRGDREVNPEPALAFAAATKSQIVELDGRCGHQAPACERATLWPAVGRFLDR